MHLLTFKRLVLIATVLALILVSLGAYVRLSDAGLGCPDWPGCYGTLTVPQTEQAISHANQAYPDKPIHHGKAWKEMAHRYVAGVLGILILCIFVSAWKQRRHLHVSPWLTSFLMAWVVFQALLGMWTVTLQLMPAVVTMHLIGGMTTLGLLVWITHRHYGEMYVPSSQHRWLKLAIRLALVVLAMQIILGGWTSTNYAGLACNDFPQCFGEWVPTGMDFNTAFDVTRQLGKTASGEDMPLTAYVAIQWAHRIGALSVMLLVISLSVAMWRIAGLQKMAQLLLLVLSVQILLGVANLVLHLPIVLAVAHNTGAALLLTLIVILNSKITSKLRG
jgi:cytochrome c oxidase assembly protein subunit 15